MIEISRLEYQHGGYESLLSLNMSGLNMFLNKKSFYVQRLYNLMCLIQH